VRTVARRTRRHGLAGEIGGGRTGGMTIQYIFCKGCDAPDRAGAGVAAGLVLRGIVLARRRTRAPRVAGSSVACVRLGNPGNVAGRNPRKSAADQRACWLAGGRLRFVAGNCMPACRIQHRRNGAARRKIPSCCRAGKATTRRSDRAGCVIPAPARPLRTLPRRRGRICPARAPPSALPAFCTRRQDACRTGAP